MQFPQQVVTEITAPNNVTFAPGNNVSGFGVEVPPELSAAGFSNAFVMYTTAWNPSNTTPTIKFWFIAANATGLVQGYGVVANPSVDQTATVVSGETVGTFLGTGQNSDILYANTSGKPYAELFELSGANFFLYDALGDTHSRIALQVLPDKSSRIVLGSGADDVSVTVTHPAGAAYFQTNAPWLYDTTWTNLSLSSGWTNRSDPGNSAPALSVLRDSSGIVHIRGLLNVGTTAGFPVVATLPVGFRPAYGLDIVATTGNSAGNCSFLVHPDGNILLDSGTPTPVTFAWINGATWSTR